MADTISKIDTKNRENNIAALAALQNTVITRLKPDSAELSDCYIKSNDTAQLIFSEGDISEKTIDTILEHLDTLRNQQSSISGSPRCSNNKDSTYSVLYLYAS